MTDHAGAAYDRRTSASTGKGFIMGLTIHFTQTSQAVEQLAGNMQRLQADPFRTYPWTFWQLPHAAVALRQSAELFLACRNTDPNRGLAGAAAVLGYVVLERPGRPKDELAQALLAAWKQHGPSFVNSLEGSFSLFLYDAAEERYLLAADPMNSRPLWLAQNAGDIIAGSDVRNAARLLPRLPLLDKAHAWSFLHRRCSVADRSFFEGIRSIEAGQLAEFHRGRLVSKTRYMEPFVRPDHNRLIRDTAAQLNDAMRQTAYEACHGSRSPALLLSGGLDSRLIAGLCPQNVTGVTVCDRLNREVHIAARIARRCGLKHDVVFRRPDFYGSMMEESSWESAAMWVWSEAHFLPLIWPDYDFNHDVAMLGFASDTLLKGTYLAFPRLWEGWQGQHGPEPTESQFVDLVLDAPRNFTPYLRPILQPKFLRECEDAVRAVIAERYRQLRQWASFAPDLWELYSFDSMYRNNCFANLTGLRRGASERNLFSSPRIYRLYLTIPCYQRTPATHHIVPKAIQLAGKGLSWLPDSNTWLPVCSPRWAHEAMVMLRVKVVSRIRGLFLSRRQSKSISGQSAWSRFDRLMTIDDTIRSTMARLVEDESAFPDDMFDRPAIRKLWNAQLDGTADFSTQLYLLASFGIFHRQITTGKFRQEAPAGPAPG